MKPQSPVLVAALVTLFLATSLPLSAQHPLESWTTRVVPGLTASLYSVAFGNGYFVAVGEGGTIARSSDGIDWDVTNVGSNGWMRVRFLNGEFVIVGLSDQMLTSTNGGTWTERSLPASNFWDIAVGVGVYVLAGETTYVSSNGVNWTQTYPTLSRPMPQGLPPELYETALTSVAFGNDRFVAMSAGEPKPADYQRPGLYSTNGVDWIQTTIGPGTRSPSPLGYLLYVGDRWLGVGLARMTDVSGVYVSSNGVDWCCKFDGGDRFIHRAIALAYGEGNYVCVVDYYPDPLKTVFSSTNAIDWIPRHSTQEAETPLAAAFGQGTFVVVGAAGSIRQSGKLSGVPFILQQPQDRGAVIGNPATFSVQASGDIPLAYQWYFNGTLISGATNPAYAISSVTTSNAGGYHAIITNSLGSVTSHVAQLTVSFLNIKAYAGIEILGVTGRVYRIEATQANGPIDWQTLTNLTLPVSPYIWIDFDSPAAGARLYRAAELP